MKKLERIFLYSVLAILVFYVFLVDNNAESQVAIQEKIRARSIAIVNDEGQEIILLSVNEYTNGEINIYNKNGIPIAYIGAKKDGYGGVATFNKKGALVTIMGSRKTIMEQ